MVMIPILGETFLNVMGGDFAPKVSGIPLSAMLAGFFAAFISGLLACKAMLAIVKRSKLYYFAIYCAIVGLLAILGGW